MEIIVRLQKDTVLPSVSIEISSLTNLGKHTDSINIKDVIDLYFKDNLYKLYELGLMDIDKAYLPVSDKLKIILRFQTGIIFKFQDNVKPVEYDTYVELQIVKKPKPIPLEPVLGELSFGERLVGKTFNPSSDPKIDKVKALCAELADILNAEATDLEERPLKKLLFDKTVGDILDAQMNLVKVITFKY